jgi:hypothetical protein
VTHLRKRFTGKALAPRSPAAFIRVSRPAREANARAPLAPDHLVAKGVYVDLAGIIAQPPLSVKGDCRLAIACGRISDFAADRRWSQTSIGGFKESELRWRSLAGAMAVSGSWRIDHGSGARGCVSEIGTTSSEAAELAAEQQVAL